MFLRDGCVRTIVRVPTQRTKLSSNLLSHQVTYPDTRLTSPNIDLTTPVVWQGSLLKTWEHVFKSLVSAITHVVKSPVTGITHVLKSPVTGITHDIKAPVTGVTDVVKSLV